MTLRVCLECMATIPAGRNRCRPCERRRDQARGSRQSRGYDTRHDRLRADYQRRMNTGEIFNCWRCGLPIDPTDWHLGHCDDDRSQHHGPEHPSTCNLPTSGRHSPCPDISHMI